jgi:DNA-binding MarR family transcriptional regulator
MPPDLQHHTVVPGPASYDDNLDPATLEAFQAMGRLFHLHRQVMSRQLSGHERHHGEVVSLRLISQADGIGQRELAEIMHLSRPRVSIILHGLEQAGAVRREADPADRRLTRVFMTEEGYRREEQNRAAFEKYLKSTVGRLSEEDKRELTRLLEEISGYLTELVVAAGSDQEARRE